MTRNTNRPDRLGEAQDQGGSERGSEVGGGVAASLPADPSEVIMAQVKAAVKSAVAELASPWLTTEEVAARLKIGRKKINALREAGVLRGGLVPGMEQFRYHRDDVDRVVVMPRRIAR